MSYDPFTSTCLSRRWDSGPHLSHLSRTHTYTSSSSKRPVRSGPAERWERAERAGGCDLAQASVVSAELLGLRAQEREQLVGLNDRFASYIEKVRRLEQQNRALLAQLEALRRRHGQPSRLQLLYQQEVRDLRAQLQQEVQDKARMEERRERLSEARAKLESRWQEEARGRGEAEEVLRQAREEAGRAALWGLDAEASAASLARELVFLQRVFAEEQEGLRAQLQAASLSVELDARRPDLAAALREIRGQYESLAGCNVQTAQAWYRAKVASVAQLSSQQEEAARAIREETAEYRRLLQSRSVEVETLRNVIDSLNAQLGELEETQSMEVSKYQGRISDLERDISEAKEEMSRYLREYHDLLNVKMGLDIEIAAYRKLLEGEETHLMYTSLPALT